MEVTYDSTREDVANFYREWERRRISSEEYQQGFYRRLFSVPLVLAFVWVMFGVGWVWRTAGLLVLCVMVNHLWKLYYRKCSIDRMCNQAGVIGLETTRLDEDGVFHQNTFAEWNVFWASVTDIVLTREFIIIFTQRDSHISVPRRAFSNDEQRQAFYDFAVTHWKQNSLPNGNG